MVDLLEHEEVFHHRGRFSHLRGTKEWELGWTIGEWLSRGRVGHNPNVGKEVFKPKTIPYVKEAI